MPVDNTGSSDAAAQPAAASVVQEVVPAAEATGREIRARSYLRISIALAVLAVIALIAALYFARAFFVPLLIGILASYALRPLVDCLQAFRIPRAIAAALVLGVLAGGVSWIGYALSDEAVAMLEKLPDAARKLRRNPDFARATMPSALQNVAGGR